MTISGLYLENFRSFRLPTSIPLRPITLLYGQNSAGKSSILKSILMLQQTLSASSRSGRRKAGMIFSGDSVDLGSFATTVSNHDRSKTLRVGIALDRLRSSTSDSGEEFIVTWDLHEEHGSPALSVQAEIRGCKLRFNRDFDTGFWNLDNSSVEQWLTVVEHGATLFDQESKIAEDLRAGLGLVPQFDGDYFPRQLLEQLTPPNLRPRARGLGHDANQSAVGSGDETAAQDATQPINIQEPLARAWEDVYRTHWVPLGQKLRRVVHVGPLRREPSRFERYVPTQDREVGRAGEQMLALLHEQPRLVNEVNNVLAMLELPYRIKVVLLTSSEAVGTVLHLALKSVTSELEVSTSDVGVGYSQVLPLITQAVLARNQLVCVEQPELHLHPAMQSRLADVFIDQSTGGNRAQFLIETHSESLMLRILRRIREGRLPPDDVQVLYVDQDETGTSVVTELPISADGEFMTRWPKGFFDERLEELEF